MRIPVSLSTVWIKSGAPPKANAALIFPFAAGTIFSLLSEEGCSGIVTNESRGIEMIVALSRDFEM